MFKLRTPPGIFAAISLLMIVAMVVSTGLIQEPFFRHSMIEREAMTVRDMVNALALERGLTASDLKSSANEAVRHQIDQSFKVLKHLPGAARIKVFNRDGTIIWSDVPELVGTKRTAHPDRVALALNGTVQALFNPTRDTVHTGETGHPVIGTIECYVPIYAQPAGQPGAEVIGVLSLYRDPRDLNRTIQNGMYLLWAVVGGAGVLLFLALYKAFSLVYERQQSAESKFGKLTLEHERIVQIEKMSAMGELVGEIAHQLNNPLVGVINLTQLAERQVHDPQRVAELLAEVRKAGSECRDIVQRILRINQPSRSTLQSTDMVELVQDTLIFCQQSVDLKHVVRFDVPQGKFLLTVDPVLIRQALFNLIHNAILAGPGQPVQVSLNRLQRDGIDGMALDVTDEGPGFSSELAPRLFKPFFTTRANGTGLGLPVAQHIALKHGGVVLAQNLPQGGARFSIWLPLMTQP
ncbi:MAG: HAMP domain-containing sensor histidine kinase [Rhodoferax sp.]|nr:HAMP domain-containing sensor histidine kinase [Rhodoferax sp.]